MGSPERSATSSRAAASSEEPLPGWALAGGGLAFLAIALEVLGSVAGDSPTSGYPGWLVPIAWPTAVRVLWWSSAAAGAVALNRGLAQATGRPRRIMTVLAAAPFVGFAIGIALGAPWATWH